MKRRDAIKNLSHIAYKTSLVIGVLFTMHSLNHLSVSIPVLLLGASVSVLFSLLIWMVNIYLVSLNERDKGQKLHNGLRYFISYLLNISLIVFLYVILPKEFTQVMFTDAPKSVHFPAGVTFLLNTIVLVIQESVVLRNKKALIELENARLRVRHTEALNQQLKQQIHPHFLFNALNVLKALIRKDPDLAEDYLVRLSDFLRVSLSPDSENKVKLENELKLCTDYLEMQRLRFGKALEYVIDIPDQVKSSGFVPGFSIQLLIENAIKHNWLTRESPLLISVCGKDGLITVTNNLQPKQPTESSIGLGLPNLSERYKILTGDGIEITRDENEFRVRIKIL